MYRKFIYIILALFFSNCFSSACQYSQPSTKFIYGKTIDTIGDSHTWVSKGNSLRCLLRDKGLQYDFVGNHLDEFGFMHDGEGGDSTQAVLNRISSIPYANAYFLLIGTNDINLTPYNTVQNIMLIGFYLHLKNTLAPIYINTLLPTKTEYNIRNQAINGLLDDLKTKNKLCQNCYILSAGIDLSMLPDWKNYIDYEGTHMTKEGYEVFTDLVMRSIVSLGF